MTLILASGSAARQAMLRNAGVFFSVMPADIDEAAIAQECSDVHAIAMHLAHAKAKHVSAHSTDALVIGSDQTLIYEGALFSKAADKGEAIEKLMMLQGGTHVLTSAVSVAQNGQVIWSAQAEAHMSMHALDAAFIETYARAAGDDVLTGCVGAYAYEAHGAWLFEAVEGDYSTILGMPLLPLLAYLRIHHGGIPL